VRRGAELRADAWYSKRLAAPFVAGWLAAEELEEEQMAVDRYEHVASERLAEQRWLGDVLPLLSRGAAVLGAGCSPTIGRELVAAGYRLTFAVEDGEAAGLVQRRLERRGLSAPVVPVGSLEASSMFEASLAFRIDRVATGRALLDVAERHSALVAASFGGALSDETAAAPGSVGGCSPGEVLERAKRRGIVLQLHDEDGTTLVVYRGQGPLGQVDRPVQRQLREAVARCAARRLGRRRPWVPFPRSGVARKANWSGQMSMQR
jgi:hypothetical protein